MADTIKATTPKELADNPAKPRNRGHLAQRLAGIGVGGLALLLLVWGLSATQWTILSTNNDIRDAVANGTFSGSGTQVYSIPQGTERDISVGLFFKPSSGGYSWSGGIDGTFYYGLAQPVSNPTTTTQYYASFSFSNPNGSAVNVWYTGPQGNITGDCGGGIPEVVCMYSPTPQGATVGPHWNFFQAPTAGNYTIHLLSTPCSMSYNYCTSTTAIVSVTRALSIVTYNRPYYYAGFVTAVVAGVAIASVIAFAIIIGRRNLRLRERTGPSSFKRLPVSD